jgi:5-methylcytosine-specific restriction endonuclease McrA
VPNREHRNRPLDPEIDHLVPVSAGGAHVWVNVALSHRRCNYERREVGAAQLRLIG